MSDDACNPMRHANPMQSPVKIKCNAKRKGGRGPCRSWAVQGKTKCRMHGGTNPGPPIRHGRHAQSLRGKLQAALNSSLNDSTLFDSDQTVAAMDAIALAQAERIEDGDGPDFRARALRLFTVARSSSDDAPAAMVELGYLLSSGEAVIRSQLDYFDLVERIDKRIVEGQKLRHAKENAIPMPRLLEVMTVLLSSVKAHAEAEAVTKITSEMSRLLGVDRSVLERGASIN